MVTHTSTKLLFNGENLIKKKFRFPNIVFEFASFTQLSNIYTMIPILNTHKKEMTMMSGNKRARSHSREGESL